MYGVIHVVIKDMIVSLYGQEAMDDILREAGLEESKHFKMFYSYHDRDLETLIDASCTRLDLGREQILEVFGDYFLVYCLRHGYDDMLRTLGCDMTGFLQSLDSLHSLLALTYDNMSAPSFRCEKRDDGSYTFHYYSSRRNYHPLVKGLINAVAREIFYKRVDIELISTEEEDLGVGRKQEHNIFHLNIYEGDRATPPLSPTYSHEVCSDQNEADDNTAPSRSPNQSSGGNSTPSSPIREVNSPTLSNASHTSYTTNGTSAFYKKINVSPSGLPDRKNNSKDTRRDKKECKSRKSSKNTSSPNNCQFNTKTESSVPKDHVGHPKAETDTALTNNEKSLELYSPHLLIQQSPTFHTIESPPYLSKTDSLNHHPSSPPMCPFGPFPPNMTNHLNSISQNGRQRLSTSANEYSRASQNLNNQKHCSKLENARRIQPSSSLTENLNTYPSQPLCNGSSTVSTLNDRNSNPYRGKRSEKSCCDGSRENVEDLTPPPLTLTSDQLCTTFPYHLIFDKQLRLRQFGRMLSRVSPVKLERGLPVTSAFHVLFPRISLTVENILQFINTIYILGVGPSPADTRCSIVGTGLKLKGQMIWFPEAEFMLFVGSPRLQSLQEMKRMDIYMSDIPLYDVTREMVLLYQQRNAEIDITKKLDETTAELKRTSRDLALEKQRTDKLLYQMLPAKVADQLKLGKKVEAEKFDQVTVLFSDIVEFTSIAAACNPLDVVNMLNNLYHKFDVQTNEHGVYKVETIGDAYMVVSGVPEASTNHAQNVADFALTMARLARSVLTPDTGKPIKIRVGVHTGPVVAGVVGVKMPRYCLFGDTVNTASRMESHGVPARIHVSLSCFRKLFGHGYVFRARGGLSIKGKGVMKTFLLIGKDTFVTSDPPDDFRDLPIATDTDMLGQSQNGNDEGASEPVKLNPKGRWRFQSMTDSHSYYDDQFSLDSHKVKVIGAPEVSSPSSSSPDDQSSQGHQGHQGHSSSLQYPQSTGLDKCPHEQTQEQTDYSTGLRLRQYPKTPLTFKNSLEESNTLDFTNADLDQDASSNKNVVSNHGFLCNTLDFKKKGLYQNDSSNKNVASIDGSPCNTLNLNNTNLDQDASSNRNTTSTPRSPCNTLDLTNSNHDQVTSLLGKATSMSSPKSPPNYKHQGRLKSSTPLNDRPHCTSPDGSIGLLTDSWGK